MRAPGCVPQKPAERGGPGGAALPPPAGRWPGYRRKLNEVQLVPQPGGILLQKRFRALQLLHDAGVLPPGEELHALVLQPAAQRPVRAADRNVKDHGLVSFAEKSS